MLFSNIINQFHIHSIVNEMGKSKVGTCDPSVGATRLLWVLAHDHQDEFVKVGKEEGLSIGVMNAVELAAMQKDAGLKRWQTITVLKHLRHCFNGKVAVPFKDTELFSDEYVKPITKKFEFEHENGDREIILCDYQNVADVLLLVLADIYAEQALSPEDVLRVDFILGGDHGIGAFRLCFRTVVKLKTGALIHKDVGVGTVVCKKDSSKVLEACIFNWLTTDLEKISQSMIVSTTDECGQVCCGYSQKSVVGQPINIYIVGDIKWLCMLVGMEDMAMHWCVHCLLSKEEWAKEGHEKGEARTIKNIKQMAADKSKSGAGRRGVKNYPYWDFIPIKRYGLPLLHIWMGIFNNIDDYFMDFVEEHIVKLPPHENKLKQDAKDLTQSISAKIEALKAWVQLYNTGHTLTDLPY